MVLQSSGNKFDYIGEVYSVLVPNDPNISGLYVYLWGAGSGGYGAYVEGKISISANQSLTIVVGGKGLNDGGATIAFGGGGRACCSNSHYGKGGGGRSAIQMDSNDIVTAGGGGGGANGQGGSASSYSDGQIQTVSGRGGDDVLSTSCTGSSGGGGSTTSGGCNGGSQYQGGDGSGYGGGGGGGYYGGGGGTYDGGGGGAGSSYLAQLTDCFFNSQGGKQLNGAYSRYYNSAAAGDTGQHGYVVIDLIYSTDTRSCDQTAEPTFAPSPYPSSPTYDPTLLPSDHVQGEL